MAYKIAVASSDGIRIDESFGSAKGFHIFEIKENGYFETEFRKVDNEEKTRQQREGNKEAEILKDEECEHTSGFGNGGCHSDHGVGCTNQGGRLEKIELISDCRCIVCKKIGFHIQKQLERKAITAFDVSCSVEEALSKISSYFQRVDKHQSLRGISL